MSGYPFTGSPVNIYQTPYNPQSEELQRLMAEFQVKYNQVLQGGMQQPQAQQKEPEKESGNGDYQKMVLGYLYDVHGITAQQFEWEFEEYCNIVREKEQKREQEVKQRVREKFYNNNNVSENTEQGNEKISEVFDKQIFNSVKEDNSKPPSSPNKGSQKFSNIENVKGG